ncbi:hypothetical protein DLAC_07141 [Tieghemostelium lacteum]|uniref:Uncharacterized protein n=1 Tax=Tieghemostelium lacteum TaxID=361077 RepID=A0A151ZDA3_TIELA|nr:hypothetical protein DLAC_07141 [Tieghemostelium lacteum]|eukprot:KYQ91905.1 hypothetical protein DLAC_07141 [Tieghemostelium lacteum]
MELLRYKLKHLPSFKITESSILDFCLNIRDFDLFQQVYQKYSDYFLAINGKSQLLSNVALSGLLDAVKLIEKRGSFDKRRYLWNACKSGNCDLVYYVLQDADIVNLETAHPSSSESSLVAAVPYKEMIRHFAQRFPSTDEVVKRQQFHEATAEASKLGLLENLKLLIELFGMKPSLCCIDIAAAYGHLDVVDYLNSTNTPFEITPFAIYKTTQLGKFENLKELVSRGFPVSSSVLSMASKKGHFEIVKYLVETLNHSVDNTSVKGAMKHNHYEILEYLLQRASMAPNYNNNVIFESCPTHYMLSHRNLKMIKLIDTYSHMFESVRYSHFNSLISDIHSKEGNDIIQYVISTRPTEFTSSFYIEYLMRKAVASKDKELVRCVTSNEGLSQAIRNQFVNILDLSCEYGSIEIVKDILEGVQTNLGLSLNSGIDFAIKKDQTAIVKLILEMKPEILYSTTSMVVAFEMNYNKTVLILLNHWVPRCANKKDPTRPLRYAIKESLKLIVSKFNMETLQILIDYKMATIEDLEQYIRLDQKQKFEKFIQTYKPKYSIPK